MANAPAAKRTGGSTAGTAPQKPAMAFKQEIARAMEGWGPDAAAQGGARGDPPEGRRGAGAAQATRGTTSGRTPAGAGLGRVPASLAAVGPDPASAAFRRSIARLESGPEGARGGGHAARNPASGALGRYQMLPVALRDIGWQDGAGGWTAEAGRHGVRSEADFLATPAAQEAAMDAFLRRTEQQLSRNGSLAQAGRQLPGLDGGAVPVTEAGLVAAAHRRGAHSVARYLAHRAGDPEAPVSPAQRQAFAAVERRLREFAEVPYALASAGPPRRTPPVGTG